MPGSVGGKNGSYPFLNRFNTKTLRQLLREDFASKEPSTPESDAFITCVADVVARREAVSPGAPQFDVDAGWRNLPQNRRPGDSEAARGEALDAFEADLSRMAARWAREMSQSAFEAGASQRPDAFGEEARTLKNLLAQARITRPVCPQWVPEGYSFSEAKSLPGGDGPSFAAVYKDEAAGKSITVLVAVRAEPWKMPAGKGGGGAAVYMQSGIEHYITASGGRLTSTWFTDNLECSITGAVSMPEMEAMIDSIYQE